MSTTQPTLGNVATLVRSKNAGPFWITLDVFCDDDASYERVAAPGVITEEVIADLYSVDPKVVEIYRLPRLRALKISFPRPETQGGISDRDMHAGQQYVPLLDLLVP
jgi:hypothetical protein